MKLKTKILLNPSCSELIIKLPEELSKEEIKKRLAAIGVEEKTIKNFYRHDPEYKTKLLVDTDNKCTPDYEHHSTIRLGNSDDASYSVIGHQHCQWQIFPTLKKISKEFGTEVRSEGGGGTGDYEEWNNNYKEYVKTLQTGTISEVENLLNEHGFWIKGLIDKLEFSKEREEIIKKVLIVKRLTEK